MKDQILRSMAVLGCVCILMVLMCTFFNENTYAATAASGSTKKKEQTIKVTLEKGASIVTVKDADSWVFAQIQSTGSDKIGEALGGERLLAPLGQQKTFVVPVKTAGDYYLYLHGTNDGASYTVETVKCGGTIKNGKAKLSTSYANNKSVVWHKITINGTGKLKVTVNDASYRYPGYSKVRLKKDDTLISGEEYLIKGHKYSTVYGVSKGTYKIGVRSSSELYKITATLTERVPAKYGTSKKAAPVIAKTTDTYGIIEPGDTSTRWYRIDLPKKTDANPTRIIRLEAGNSNVDTTGGVNFKLYFKSSSNGELVSVTENHMLNNAAKNLTFKLFKSQVRTVYIKVNALKGASASYRIYWK